jgi:hypothetical protein
MNLVASYLHKNAISPAWFLAIDVTIQAPPTPSTGASQPVATSTSHPATQGRMEEVHG